MKQTVTPRPRIAVILGGSSNERPVSLKSGSAVAKALDPGRYRVMLFDPMLDMGRLVKYAPRLDAALVMLHGRGGEDGTIQGLLDLLGVPYQCSGVLGCALAMDKVMSKERYRQVGIPVAPDLVLQRGDLDPADRVMAGLGLPVVVKPAREGSSFGISMVHEQADLAPALEAAFKLDQQVLVERLLEGREITAGMIGNDELTSFPLIEIIPGEEYGFFDYRAKYLPGASNEVCPAPIDEASTALIQDLGRRAHRALCCQGYSRSDFILTADGPFILETNTIPGMTETSLLPLAASQAGLSFPALVARLVELALERRSA